ncbi:hypothetical protein PTTG_27135 [Puccinia triticina 1-1 BBBD Race 1]|uniref:Ribosomal RNA-processing protein 14/surfeit locus protein 6 C-terminal domain-containing protein n=2 Tax=Puccinia triticina TaxID=208348 RepID=A0A180GMF1_PUCT1|nr:uncharacterized protein PtA15_2A726 [Puccinia triticina]OAV93890.1 hypothetical protein PTTG_27135 [Puccinia triticina 1-1 BBBD Race 1]WAQ82409.1 hypothetical protein PtA15_2A726 [Puccinia triticina]
MESENANGLEALRASILAHDQQFQELMRMIPPKYYIAQQQFSLTFPNNTQKSGKKNKKYHQPVDPEAKRLQKRAKYDPDTLPTIPQLQGLNKSAGDKSQSSQKTTKTLPDGDEESEATKDTVSPAAQLSRAELQAKLQKRIEVLQGTSQRTNLSPENSDSVGLTGKDALLNLERKKRGEMRDRRRKERKEARSKEKQLKLEQTLLKKKKSAGSSSKPSNAPSGSGNRQKGGKTSEDVQPQKEVSKDPALQSKSNQPDPSPSKADKHAAGPTAAEGSKSSTKNSAHAHEPDLAFSSLSFDLKQSSAVDGAHSHGHKNPSWTSKKPQEAKTALDRREAYLEKLTPEARERAEESKKWEKANLQASGTKVMDDRKKIEKALKKQTKEKKKKKHQWDERIKVVEKLKEDKQKKRNENIQARKDQIRDKKKGIKAKGNPHPNKKSKSSTGKKPVKGF